MTTKADLQIRQLLDLYQDKKITAADLAEILKIVITK